MRNYILLFIVALSIFMASCSPIVLKGSDTFNESKLLNSKTFVLQSPLTKSLPLGIQQSDIEHLQQSVVDELTSRGYTQVKRNADMTVQVYFMVKNSREMSVNSFSVGSRSGTTIRGNVVSSSRSRNATVSTNIIRDGVIVLDIITTDGREHLYFSKVSADLNRSPHLFRDNELLNEVTTKLLKKFP